MESTGSIATEQSVKLLTSSCLSFTKLDLELNHISSVLSAVRNTSPGGFRRMFPVVDDAQ